MYMHERMIFDLFVYATGVTKSKLNGFFPHSLHIHDHSVYISSSHRVCFQKILFIPKYRKLIIIPFEINALGRPILSSQQSCKVDEVTIL